MNKPQASRFDKFGRPLAFHIWRGDELLDVALTQEELERAYRRLFAQGIQRKEIIQLFQYSEYVDELLGQE